MADWAQSPHENCDAEEKASAKSAFSRVAAESEMGGDDNTRLVFESDSESSDDEEEEDDIRGEDGWVTNNNCAY